MHKKIRIGIIGTGRIAKRFVPELGQCEGVELTAVYNPHISSAEAFARMNDIEKYTDSLKELYEEADAVYVAAPHDTHYDYTKQLLEAGKHVLCEKPLCFSGRQAEELFALADKKDLILMEAVKTAYCPGFNELLEVAKSGIIGEIKDVEACFTKLSDPEGRELNSEKYAGSFYELGSYAILPAVKLLGRPDDVSFQSIMCGKADGFTKAYMTYDGKNAYALAKTGLTVKSEGCLIVSGTKGYILAKSPWWLTKEFEVRFDDPSKVEVHNCSFEGQGLRYEIRVFLDKINRGADFVKNGLLPQESVWMAEIMEKK